MRLFPSTYLILTKFLGKLFHLLHVNPDIGQLFR